MNDYFKHIQALLSQGQTEEAITALWEVKDHIEAEYAQQITLLSGRFYQWKQELNLGLVENNVERRRVETALLALLAELNKTSEYQAATGDKPDSAHSYWQEAGKALLKSPKKIVLNSRSHPYEVQCLFDQKASLGRSADCDFSFRQASSKVSNWHARIQYDPSKNEYVLEDTDSTNGTYFNNVRIEQAVRLKFGSKIGLGPDLTFLFEHSSNDPQSVGTLLYFTDDGHELARYVIIPATEVLVGTNLNDKVRHPLFPAATTLGEISKLADAFYFVKNGVAGSKTKVELRNEMNLDIYSIPFLVTMR